MKIWRVRIEFLMPKAIKTFGLYNNL